MKLWKYVFGFLILANVSIWIAAFTHSDRNLHLVACDVGQGDAILIYQKNTQILIDGGPDNKVINCLGKYLPFWDKKLELVILTHPQLDHLGGLVEVFNRYEVENFFKTEANSSTQSYQLLENEVGSRGINTLIAKTGMVIRVGLTYLDIVHPQLGYKTSNVNNYSMVVLLKYHDFEALLAGDIETDVSDELAGAGFIKDVEYIKIPHHGSKNGLSQKLLDAVNPEVAVISAGKNNRYGHPHEEVLKMLKEKDIKILRTDQLGDIELVTDGKSWWLEN